MTKYLTITQVAENLGVAVRTVRAWKSKQKIPFLVLPGGDLRFNEAEMERWCESRTVRKKKNTDKTLMP